MSIKDKITPELKDRFISAIKMSMKTGKENRFIICRDKEENLYTPRSTECPSYLQLEGEFHTHPYATIEKKKFEEETHTKVPLENIKKLLIDENKKLKRDISGPSYNDVLTTLSLKCQGKNGTICIVNDLESDRLECWTAKKEIPKEFCDKVNKELSQQPKGSPQPWTEHLFDKEIIKLKTDMQIEKEKRKTRLREEKRRLEEEKEKRILERKIRLGDEKIKLEKEKKEKEKRILERKIKLGEEKIKLEKEKKEKEKRMLEEKKRKLEEKIKLEEKKITLGEKRRLEKKKIILGEIITEREERRELLLKSRGKKGLCRSLQEIVSQVKDPDSIFTDIDLVRKYTGCPIPTRKKNI